MIGDIWRSWWALPAWVQVWVALILVPVNVAALWFLSEPGGGLIALLAVGAMVLNGPIMLWDRGFSKLMALPHVLVWTPLVVLVAAMLWRGEADGAFRTYLVILLVTDLVSLGFDIPDLRAWWRGDRAVAGP